MVSLIQKALAEISVQLRGQPNSPSVRGWRTKAASYEHTVARWKSAPPTETQAGAMYECVIALHMALLGTSGTSKTADTVIPPPDHESRKIIA